MGILTTDGRRRLLLRSLQLSDLSLYWTALAINWLGFPERWGPVILPPKSWYTLAWLLGSSVLWHACLAKADLYRSRRLSAGAGELWDIVKGTTLGTAFMAALGLGLGSEFITPRMVQGVWLTAVFLTTGWRITLRVVLAIVRRSGRNLRLVLLIGSGPRARRLISDLERRGDIGYRVIGYIDDQALPATEGSPAGPQVERLGALADLPAVLASNAIDEVFIALPVKSCYDRIASAVRACEAQGIQVQIPVDLFDLRLANLRLDAFEGIPVLALTARGIHGWYAVAKRVVDIAASFSLLLALAPLFAVVAALIKWNSSGPVFFRQERVGLHKRRFTLIKFRTMVQNGEALLPDLLPQNEISGPVFKIANDPRVTSVGRFLRRTSIDEFPQLINVLKGDMSLVGPRPLPLRDVEGFTEDWQRRRFSVKPGITGLWQVSGRSSISFDQWMELDMTYIDRSSLSLDFRILLRTIPAVIRGTGAY